MGRPKGSTSTKTAVSTAPAGDLDLLKAKLRRKYALLRDKALDQTNRDELLLNVCSILGMTRIELDWVLKDL
jgi:hypothetical protein